MSAAAKSDAVVVGEVVRVGDATPMPGGAITHHDPTWTPARVRVLRTLSGGGVPDEVTVSFSASTDVCCYARPKLAEKEVAIFVLRRGEAAQGYRVTNGDVIAEAQESRLRRVLGCPPDPVGGRDRQHANDLANRE